MNYYFLFILLILMSCASSPENEKEDTVTEWQAPQNNLSKVNFDFELTCDGQSPLTQAEYLKHFNIKSYKEVKFLKRGGAEVDTIIDGKFAKTIEFKKFDRQGNISTDYHFLAEGPLIHRYKYTYNKENQITQKLEVSPYFNFPVEDYYYSENGILDSILLSTLYSDSSKFLEGKKHYNSGKEVFLYKHLETGIMDTVHLDNGDEELTLDQKGRIIQWKTEHQCRKYTYDTNLLVSTSDLDTSCTKEHNTTWYVYDEKGLLIKKVSGPDVEFEIIYEFY